MICWQLLADAPSLSLAPVISLWLLVPGVFILVGLSIYLYQEQRRIAAGSTVFLLTLVRAGLIALLALLFLQPAFKWTQTRTTLGTLWLVVDQSPSMQTPDPQALPAERLHWAEGQGLLDLRKPTDRPDALAAKIHALTGEFEALAPASSSTDPRDSILAFAKAVSDWVSESDQVIAETDAAAPHLNTLANDPGGANQGAGAAALDALGQARSLAQLALSPIRASSTLEEANAALQENRVSIDHALALAQTALQTASAAADRVFLRDNATEPALASATARVTNVSRGDLAYGFLAGDDARAAKSLAELAKKYHLRVASFADKPQAVGLGGGIDPSAIPDTLKAALAPAGQSTNIDTALQYVSEQIATDEAASVVILTDGRNNVPGDPSSPARNLAARGVKVYGLLAGSHEVSPDAAVEQVDAPDWVYKGDTIKGRALIRLDGLAGKTAQVEFKRDDYVISRQNILATSNHQTDPIDFSDKPPESATAASYQVHITEMPGEVNTQNNLATFRVSIKKDKLYALFIDDRPRWEFRYLAATLARDQRMKIQTVLLAPAFVAGVTAPAPVKASPDNPRDEAQLLPATLQEWQAFDIIILGDISPEVLTPQAQQFIAAAVRDKGATLITVAGQRHMPAAYANSPLAELLPVTLDPQWNPEAIAHHLQYGFRPGLAPTAGASVLGQFEMDSSANARVWSSIPPWYWHSPYTQAKSAASVIWTIGEPLSGNNPAAEIQDPIGSIAAANKHALLSTINIGSGRSLYLASDQTWRLRQVNGDNMHERFWGQVLRWAVGSDLPAGGKFVRFGSNQPVYAQDQPAIITARILRDDLTPYTGLAFSAVAKPAQSAPASTTESSALTSQSSVEARFTPMESPGYYTATLGGLPLGDVEIALKGAEVQRLFDNDPTVTQRTLLIKVEPTMNAERRNMNTDPELLEQIARAGGGYSLDANYADLLFSHLPEIKHTESIASQIGFFTDPDAAGTKFAHWSFLILFASLLTTEWILRKRAGLV